MLDILQRLEARGYETWAVGGAVRDQLLGHAAKDVDLATAATPDVVRAIFPRTVPVGIEHGTVGVLDRHHVLHEVTTFRRDVHTDGRHAVVEFGVSLDDDLARRDFTINAIAWHPLRAEWRDPFDGRGDLARGILRTVGDPGTRFREDRLRILRALRFAARFGFRIAAGTWDALVAEAPATGQLSAERIREEWLKASATARDLAAYVADWRASGMAAVWLPELRSTIDVRLDALVRDPVLLSAAVASPIAPVWRRFKGSSAEIRRAELIDRGPSAPTGDDPRSVRRWMMETAHAAPDLIALAAAATSGAPAWVATAHGIQARGEPTARGDLAITGNDLQALGMASGPAIGTTLQRLLDAVIDEPSRNTREQLLALARQQP